MSMRKSLAVVALAALSPSWPAAVERRKLPRPRPPARLQPLPPPPRTAGGAAGSASIAGKISFAGTAPAPEKIKISADP